MGIKKLFSIGILFALASCQTPRIHDFERVHLGQEKGDVVQLMGNPTSTQRVNGEDRWSYVMYDNQGVRLEKVLQFYNGYVVYKGDVPTPVISAELQDDINKRQNIELNKLNSEKESSKSTTSAARENTDGPRLPNATSTKGDIGSTSQSK